MSKKTIPLSEFILLNPSISLNKDMEYPFIEMETVSPGRRYVSARSHRTYGGGGAKFRTGDTLFARITPCLENGKIAQFKGPKNAVGFGSTEFFIFSHREGISDPNYIFYLALSDIIRKPAEKSMSGASGRQRADFKSIKDLEIPAPSLPTQRKIAAILASYDDLIENNTRRIAILEEMAQSLYREWFVHFRFQGHEKKRMVESPLGMIPGGWEVVKFSAAVEIDPPTRIPKEGEKPFVSMANLSSVSMLIDSYEMRSGNGGSKFKNDDTLFARITPCLENGKTGYVQFLPSDQTVAFGSTEFIVLRSKTLCPEYVYLMARSNEFRDNAIKSMTGATGRQRVQVSCFDKFLLAHPDTDTLTSFRELVAPLFRNVYILAQKNANLRQTRDLLLPKLISGEVDVEELDIHIEEGTYESSGEPVTTVP